MEDLIPPDSIVALFCGAARCHRPLAGGSRRRRPRRPAEYVEEHTGDEGLLEEAVNDKGNVTKAARWTPAAVDARGRAVGADEDGDEEIAALGDAWN